MITFSLFGRTFPANKSIFSILVSLFGISYPYSLYVLKMLGCKRSCLASQMTSRQFRFVVKVTSRSRLVGSNLRSFRLACQKKKLRLRIYQGFRLFQGLPANGQRSHSNAQTCRRLKWSR